MHSLKYLYWPGHIWPDEMSQKAVLLLFLLAARVTTGTNTRMQPALHQFMLMKPYLNEDTEALSTPSPCK